MAQLKVTLPVQLYDRLFSQARKFGLTMSAYIKHLILDDVREMELPTFHMSAKTETVVNSALRNHRRGKTTKINDVDKWLTGL